MTKFAKVLCEQMSVPTITELAQSMYAEDNIKDSKIEQFFFEKNSQKFAYIKTFDYLCKVK